MLLGSIRGKLLALVLAVVVPLLAVIVAGVWNQRQSTYAAAKERALNDARMLAAQLDDHVGNLEHLLGGLSRAVSTDRADISVNDSLLRQAKAELPGFISGIGLFDLAGENIGTSSTPPLRTNIGDRLHFRQILAGQRLAMSDVHIGRITRQWVVNIARRVEDRTGALQAVLVAGTLLERFPEFLRLDALPHGSVVRILNEQGVVVAGTANGPNWIGRDLSDSTQTRRLIAAKEASGEVRWSDGIMRLTGSTTAHRVPWLVSVGLPKEAVFATVASHLRWSALLSAIAVACALAIAWMLSGRIVRPLQQLEKDASVLAAGELAHRTAVSTGDEVGKLADAFNRMAIALERRQDEVQQASDTLAAVIDASPVAICCSDLERRIIMWNRSAEQLYGYRAEEVLGQPIKVVPPESATDSLILYQRARGGETIRDVQVKRLRKDGTPVHVRLAAAPMHNRDGSVRGVAWALEDITDRRRVEEELKRLAHYDPLTGLPNRLSLQKELGRLLAGDGRTRPTGLALFDLDEFKDVNDTLGHSTGDQLLVEIGQRFTEATESRGKVARVFRLSGDEFVVVVPSCGDPCVMNEIALEMLGRLAQPFHIGDHALHLGASAGIAIAPNDGITVDELIANADLALYQAKADGGRVCRQFQPVLRAQAQARRSLDADLRRAFAQNEFEIYFQPQVRLADTRVVGAEALLRWRHPQRGVLAPGAFMDALAASSIAEDVGRWIIRTACAQTASWHAMGIALGRIAVNLFPSQLHEHILLRDVEGALAETGLRPETLEIEVTENVALRQKDGTKPLCKLREKGVQLALDDFGTGYASLSYLTRLPLSHIKIDRSFVCEITHEAADAAIVRSVLAMARNLGLAVIAEGVETEAQATFLRRAGCEEAQGFLYGEPLPASEFEHYLRARPLAAACIGNATVSEPDHPMEAPGWDAARLPKARSA